VIAVVTPFLLAVGGAIASGAVAAGGAIASGAGAAAGAAGSAAGAVGGAAAHAGSALLSGGGQLLSSAGKGVLTAGKYIGREAVQAGQGISKYVGQARQGMTPQTAQSVPRGPYDWVTQGADPSLASASPGTTPAPQPSIGQRLMSGLQKAGEGYTEGQDQPSGGGGGGGGYGGGEEYAAPTETSVQDPYLSYPISPYLYPNRQLHPLTAEEALAPFVTRRYRSIAGASGGAGGVARSTGAA